ncbi:MAG TPA: 5-formyltetrahydrofolate cyclo-ligase [Thermoplasmatales archaeon]|nr:5-formyltetrahydrofolate cyclo-ligase [Thermoplasmatales archaeon]
MIFFSLSKEELRKKIKEKRDKLSQTEIWRRSEKIIEKLTKMNEFVNADAVACYISFGNEVNTHFLIKNFIEKKKILVPFVDKGRKEIRLSHLKNWEELHTGEYGILEPKKEFLRIENNADIFIIPGIVFDESGNRIGYGGGYFDRFLSDFKGKKIALAYEFQIIKKMPNEKHDVKMDFIVTDKRIIKVCFTY